MPDDQYSPRVRQFAYFALKSETTSAAAMTAALGVTPDRIKVRGERTAVPPVPVAHSWSVECRTPGRTVDEQVAEVLARIRPVAGRVRRLVATGSVSAVLQVVRDFDADDGEEERHTDLITDSGMTRSVLSGQHQLLGWHLAATDLAFLGSLPADLDIDEYS